MSPFTFVVISDVHDAERCVLPQRRGDLGAVLLLRAVHRLNRMIRPDAVVFLGDLIDDPDAPDAMDRLRELKRIIDLVEAPTIVLPGNHDPDPDRFYEVMERPDEIVEIGNVRFLPFVDPEAPGYNATRRLHDLERLERARRGHDGPVVALQHVPVLPPGTTNCPYSYTNIDDIVALMERESIDVAVGGHYHAGTEPVRTPTSTYLTVKALCEAPFSFTVITLNDGDVEVVPYALQMPPELGLVDYHSHTQLAYCQENMRMEKSLEIGKAFGLAGLALTEHSGQLYFERSTYWSGAFGQQGIATTEGRQSRMDTYWAMSDPLRQEGVIVGLEVDADFQGNPVLKPEDRKRADLLVGAVHFLPETQKKQPDPNRVDEEFMAVLERFLSQGIHILAHPFRIYRRKKLEPPKHLYEKVARLLKEHNVVAEVNYHTNTPDPEFFRLCIEMGVKLSFGSDAHNQYEIGEFAPHVQLVREAGYDGELGEILFRWTQDVKASESG